MNSRSKEQSINEAFLDVSNISLNFGGTRALIDVSMSLRNNEILAIIGPNGAGKTSLMNCITGFYKPQKGNIYFMQKEITKLQPRKIAKLGLARTFQNLRLFTESTVLTNLMTGAHMHLNSSFLEDCIYFGRSRKQDHEQIPRMDEILRFLDLEKYRESVVGKLPYGVRKRVELGRALSMKPRLLMLDEPMAGMSREEKDKMCTYIVGIADREKLPIILIEHDMNVVMKIANRIAVLNFGVKIAEGNPEEITKDEEVIRAYLGETLENESEDSEDLKSRAS